MSDLINIGRSGVLAYQGALAAVGENVTNADTDGYSRREVVLTEQFAGANPYSVNRTSSAFGGVRASAVQRVWDQYKAMNAWSGNADSSRADTRAQYLANVETMLDDSNTGVGTRLTAVFTSAASLASNPSDTTLRKTMLAAIGGAAAAIGQTGANLAKVAATVKSQAIVTVDQVNGQLADLGRLNVALHGATPGTAQRAQLEDQRDALLTSLTTNLGVDVTLDASGAASVRMNDYAGPMLLAGDDAQPAFLALQIAADGRLGTTVARGGAVVSSTPSGGGLAGLVAVSQSIAGSRQTLDGMAAGFATALNAWNAGGLKADNTAGGALLTGTTAATLAAATDDPAAIAAATAGGDNANLLGISALREPDGIEAQWRSLVTGQALLVQQAKTEQTAAATRKDGAYAALDQVSGVDLDTEAAELLRFQQAYNASAKVLQTARDTLQSILALF